MNAADRVYRSRALYLAKLRTEYPNLYGRVVGNGGGAIRNGSLGGFWDSVGTTFNSVLSNVTKSLPQIANTYAQFDAQKDLLKLNTERVRQGLPPLSYVNGKLVAPDGQTYSVDDYRLAQSSGIDTPTILMLGAAAVVVGILLLKR